MSTRPRRPSRRLLNEAARYYTIVAETEPGYASAGFGLARVFLGLGDRDGAVAALQRIPEGLECPYVTAEITLCRARCAVVERETPLWDHPGDLRRPRVRDASRTCVRLSLGV